MDLTGFFNSENIKDEQEKTAESVFYRQLQEEDQVKDRPLAHLSDDQLIELLKTASAGNEGEVGDQDEQEKLAGEILAGEIMAHAMIDEMVKIKIAQVNGLCRVCKTNPMDIEGSSICSACDA